MGTEWEWNGCQTTPDCGRRRSVVGLDVVGLDEGQEVGSQKSVLPARRVGALAQWILAAQWDGVRAWFRGHCWCQRSELVGAQSLAAIGSTIHWRAGEVRDGRRGFDLGLRL
jgi:hypothetical protein